MVNGFDYRSGERCARTRKEWRGEVQAALEAGGHMKRSKGERWIYSARGRILFEIYDGEPVAANDEGLHHGA